MSQDWEKLGGETGEAVPTGRLSRALTLGTMGARVTASSVASKIGGLMLSASKDKREAFLQQAQLKKAEMVVEALGRLKGASMKVGQMLSADPELIPAGLAEKLSSLQSSAPPMTYQTVRAQIEAAYDRPMETIFAYFDPTPIGSASIGQVHRARLESGEEVAVKIQYPGVVESLESDLKSLATLLSYGRAVIEKTRLDAYVKEIRNVILQESDYLVEAENLARFYDRIKEREGLRSPKPYPEHSRKSVLVMEFMEGTKLDDALERIEPGERRDEILRRWVAIFSWMFHECHELHADPHPGNFLLDADDAIVILDFGCVKAYSPEFTDGFLDVLDASWQDDPKRAIELYFALGYGRGKTELDPDLMRDYHAFFLAPFLSDAPFAFGDWKPGSDAKAFMFRHPSFFQLVPPAEALPYFRVLSGIKGLLAKMDATINVCDMAIDTARRRGRLTGEPKA
ncbi:MAG: AarF/ABC1/UbiB kinase family protein [Bradymonadaceae bacterium]|nr:AarF/ABC1/UbiB kinase family protein [Lujinxingiaceae bacterium]